ncbi:arylamine N-acetyltransferase family protein [Streptomyces beihaiensis]|uniref:Arylamine N-acetyltransferase n=1 Tax=Streptomyces beihaiensis TaxID=2984495 RepID=A0ABT3TXR2_9ACTN|nr:arylamine N-acetyltransferase [Streptomyces beihaiensis]MCX3061833.1 arylamine N-acetyltransferase [Streptomyces beihaiensis]
MIDVLTDAQVDAYLDRIGAPRPEKADFEALRLLQERQCLAVPFENLDYHLDAEVHMDERAVHKIVDRRRGGGCYEVNPAFALLLRTLGYEVEILPGQVYRPEGPGPFLGHLALRVRLDGFDWLVDTGFGRNSRHPLRFDVTEPQTDPHGTYEVRPNEEFGGHDVFLGGRPLYRVGERAVRVADFAPTLWWWRTAPESPFLQDLFCSLPTEDGGRITLKGDRLTVVGADGRTTVELPDDAAVLAAYREHFGIALDRLPGRPADGSAEVQTG